jgi:Uma2 family endonuclease
MTTFLQTLTAQDLERLPDDGFRYELVRGQLRKMAPAAEQHGRITGTLTVSLGQHVLAHGLGAIYAAETGFLLSSDPDTVRAPDVAFISRARLEAIGPVEGYWSGAPDLAVEVISPGDTYAEVEEKVVDWLQAGTRLVVVVNPRQRLVTIYRSLAEVLVLTPRDTLDGEDVVPGWTLKIAELFS